MHTREIGRTGIKISVVGFGGMRIPSVDPEEALATLVRALEAGITFYETGNGYGQGRSELLFGQGLAAARNGIVLANKTGAGTWDRPDKIRKNIEDSLKAQQTDYFDMFSFWGVNNRELFDTIKNADAMTALVKAREDGLIRAIGFTTHAQPEEIVRFTDELPFDCVTLKYNILTTRMEKTIADLHAKGVGVVVMTPLAGGMVANPGPELKAKLDGLGVDPAVVGLRYLTANPGVTAVIAGMRHPSEVDVNVQAGGGEPLTDNEKQAIRQIQDQLAGLGETFCTQCGYCMPCPQGVGIPSVFRLWNIMRGYGADQYSRGEYSKMAAGIHWADYRGKTADACVECGQCEPKCPENLPIMENLKKAHTDLAPPRQ